MHEAQEGEYDFSGDNDLIGFIEMAQTAGLLVIVRAGQLLFLCLSILTTVQRPSEFSPFD